MPNNEDRFKLNIILDLDQTCISAEETDTFNVKKHLTNFNKYIDVNQDGPADMDGIYTIFERPHLQEFLDYIFVHFNVSVWTAASETYGIFVIENIIAPEGSGRQLDFYLNSQHCSESRKIAHATKNLDMLYTVWKLPGYTPYNTIIIDDLKEIHTCQPENCISIKAFEFTKRNAMDDKELLHVIEQLKLFNKK